MLKIIRRTIRDKKWLLITYCSIAGAFMMLYAALYPSFADQSAEFAQAFQAYPQEFLKAFGVEDITEMFASFEGFVGGENFGLIWPLIVILIATTLASGLIAGEVQGGQIEITLSQPVSRFRIFLSRYIAGLIVLALFIVFSIYSVFPFAMIFNIDLETSHWHILAFGGTLFTWSVFGIGMMFSSIFSERGKVSLTVTFIMVLMYAAYLVSNFLEDFDAIKYISFFHYFDGNALLVDGNLESLSIWIFASTILLSFMFGAIFFTERDISV